LKYKALATAAILAVFLSGCATIPVSKEILEFTITPDKGIQPGTFVVVVVKTTENVEKVYGYLDVMGSPKISLKYNPAKKVWVFGVPIPVGQAIPKGEFTAKVEAITKSGEKYTAEKKVSTY
jgi:PBP1b-binding outer membrane lipoprotein LpoB